MTSSNGCIIANVGLLVNGAGNHGIQSGFTASTLPIPL